MEAIDVGDFVEIVQAGADEQHLLHKKAKVVSVIDGATYILVFEDGSSAIVDGRRLKKP